MTDLYGSRKITIREYQVLKYLADGMGNKEIGAKLGISANVVKNHLRDIYDKIGVSTRLGAALWFVVHTA